MSAIGSELRGSAGGKVLVREVTSSHLVTPPATVHTMDIVTMTPADQDFSAEFILVAPPGGEEPPLACLVLWFDVAFSGRYCQERAVTLSTAPGAAMTHWMQAVLPLKAPLQLAPGGELSCRLSMARRRSQHRALDMSLEYGRPGAAREVVSFCMQVGGSD